jgi:predicted peroxiredoxin
VNRLAILLWAATPEQPDLCAAPFVYAMAAAALDAEVEIHFAGKSVRLLEQGVAERAITSGGKSLYAFMQEASALGVRFFACSMAMEQFPSADGVARIPQLSGKAGATTFAQRALDDEWRTLVF